MNMRIVASILASSLAMIGMASAQEVIVYTSYEKEDLGPYKAAFEKDVPGMTIRWVHDANGVITARLLAEKSNPRADAVWGVAASSLGQLADADVLLSYTPPGFDKIPTKFRDPTVPPRWFGNSAWVAAIVYNTTEGKKLGIPKPESWADLAKPVYKGKVVMPHPLSSGTGFLDVSAWLQGFGEEEGWKFMDALHQSIARYTHSMPISGATPIPARNRRRWRPAEKQWSESPSISVPRANWRRARPSKSCSRSRRWVGR